MLEIDRAAATYSVARFDEIAKAHAIADPAAKRINAQSTAATGDAWKTTPLGVTQSRAGRSADAFEIVSTTPESIKVEVAVDRQVTLSRQALDALVGSGYPNKISDQQEAVARACVRSVASASLAEVRAGAPAATLEYGLPLEQSITFATDANKRFTVRNSVVRVSNELPPPEVLAIPAGAKLVESRPVQMQKTLRELEHSVEPRP
jgi:hypothetical protein